jgi:hypothetical protein
MTHDNKGCAHGFNIIMRECYHYNTVLAMYLQDDWLSTEPLTAYMPDIFKMFEEQEDVGYLRLRSVKEKVWHKNRVSRKGFVFKSAFPSDKYCPILRVKNMHFTLNPIIVRTDVLGKMLPIIKEQDAMDKYEQLGLFGSQLKANCFRHIGNVRAYSRDANGKVVWQK